MAAKKKAKAKASKKRATAKTVPKRKAQTR